VEGELNTDINDSMVISMNLLTGFIDLSKSPFSIVLLLVSFHLINDWHVLSRPMLVTEAGCC
jgi:hypothetical protein